MCIEMKKACIILNNVEHCKANISKMLSKITKPGQNVGPENY